MDGGAVIVEAELKVGVGDRVVAHADVDRRDGQRVVEAGVVEGRCRGHSVRNCGVVGELGPGGAAGTVGRPDHHLEPDPRVATGLGQADVESTQRDVRPADPIEAHRQLEGPYPGTALQVGVGLSIVVLDDGGGLGIERLHCGGRRDRDLSACGLDLNARLGRGRDSQSRQNEAEERRHCGHGAHDVSPVRRESGPGALAVERPPGERASRLPGNRLARG